MTGCPLWGRSSRMLWRVQSNAVEVSEIKTFVIDWKYFLVNGLRPRVSSFSKYCPWMMLGNCSQVKYASCLFNHQFYTKFLCWRRYSYIVQLPGSKLVIRKKFVHLVTNRCRIFWMEIIQTVDVLAAVCNQIPSGSDNAFLQLMSTS